MLKRILAAGLKTGGVLAVTTTLAVMAASERDSGNAWNAINAICHIADGDDISQPTGFQARESLLGLALNATVMLSWGLLYEGALALTRSKSTPVTGAGAAAGIYALDYHCVPERFKPGIEKRISPSGIALAYGALAATLSLSSLWNRYPDTTRP